MSTHTITVPDDLSELDPDTAVWTRVAGEVVWLTVLLVVLAVAGLVTAGLILRGEARR